MKEALAFPVLSNFSSIQFSGSNTCLITWELQLASRAESVLSIFYSLHFSEPEILVTKLILPHWLSVTQEDNVYPVWLHQVNSALSPCEHWPWWPEFFQNISSFFFLTSPSSWLSWILNLFLLPSSSTFSLSNLAQCFNMDWATLLALTLTLLVWHNLPCSLALVGTLQCPPTLRRLIFHSLYSLKEGNWVVLLTTPWGNRGIGQ